MIQFTESIKSFKYFLVNIVCNYLIFKKIFNLVHHIHSRKKRPVNLNTIAGDIAFDRICVVTPHKSKQKSKHISPDPL